MKDIIIHPSHPLKNIIDDLIGDNVTVNDLKDIVRSGKSPIKIAFAMSILKSIQSGNVKDLADALNKIGGLNKEDKPARLKLFD